MSPYGWLCKECYEFKKATEEDRELTLKYVEKMTAVAFSKIRYKDCFKCIILREIALSLYKMIKELKEEAEKENFESILEQSKLIESKLKRLLLTILVAQGLHIPEENHHTD